MTELLIIYGLTLEDIDNGTVVARPPAPAAEPQYTNLPDIYTPSTWPSKSNRLCYYCGNQFTCYPKFIPFDMLPDGTCKPFGNFHTWECAAAYAVLHMPTQAVDLLYNIACMRSTIEKHPRHQVLPAPDYTTQKRYSGAAGLTAEEYNRELERISKVSKTLHF